MHAKHGWCKLALLTAVIVHTGPHIAVHTEPLLLHHSLVKRIAGSTVGTPHYPLQVPLLPALLHLLPGRHIVEHRFVLFPRGIPERSVAGHIALLHRVVRNHSLRSLLRSP